jgi:imidazole glycerol-phosphate synthase subunit HisF
MLKKRLIPKLQMKPSKIGSKNRMVLVTTVNFDKVIEIGDPLSQAKIFEAQAADELIFLDLDAHSEDRDLMIDIIKKSAEEIFMPFTVGGGVRTLKDIRILLSNGADKVSINTAAIENPQLVNDSSKKFGVQCIVLSIDYKKDDNGNYFVYKKGGKVKTDLDPVNWAIEGEKRGAGEILITSIDNDGSQNGLDLIMTQKISEAVKIPVITSGGCGLASHFSDGFTHGKADGVSAGTFFCFKDQNPMQTRSHIKNAGISIRMHT